MAQKVTAWKAIDGQLFETEDDAKAHDFDKAFSDWMAESFAKWPPDVPAFKDVVMRDRMKLLSIFKLLNGGNPQAAPVRPFEPLLVEAA